jgi:hypothetical protein
MIDIIYTYYNQHKCLTQYINHWNNNFNDDVKKQFNIIIVDDHSQQYKASDIIKQHNIQFNTQIYYITDDKGFNVGGARNLGALKCTADRFLNMDFDLCFSESNIKELLALDVTDKCMYRILRDAYKVKNGKKSQKYHHSAIVMLKSLWEDGYIWDEDFAPLYGWEDHYFIKVFQEFGIEVKYVQIDFEKYKNGFTSNLKRGGLESRNFYTCKLECIQKPINPIRFNYELEYDNII